MAITPLGIIIPGEDPATEPVTPLANRFRDLGQSVEAAILAVSATEPPHVEGRRWLRNGEVRISIGGTWQPEQVGAPVAVTSRRSTDDNFAANTWANLTSVTISSSAPSGIYRVTFAAALSCTQAAMGYLRGLWGTTDLVGDDPFNVSTDIRTHSATVHRNHTRGSATAVIAQGRVSAGTGTARPGCRVTVDLIGRT